MVKCEPLRIECLPQEFGQAIGFIFGNRLGASGIEFVWRMQRNQVNMRVRHGEAFNRNSDTLCRRDPSKPGRELRRHAP